MTSKTTSELLNSLEQCPKQAQLYLSGIEREALTFHQLLSRGVDHGLTSLDPDPGRAAADEVLRLAWSRPIETEQQDLLGLAEHCSALAEMVTWCLRTGPAWMHPAPLKDWIPSCWQIPGGLRRVVLCDRWDAVRALQDTRDWKTLEGAVYGLPVTILAVVLGAMRDGRRHGPLTKGWLHPRSRELRFRKRDGSGFEGAWEPVFRESFDGDREEWLQAMTADGVMEETFVIHPEITWSEAESQSIRMLADSKRAEIRALLDRQLFPDRSLSRCFEYVHPCEFRYPCSFFKEPEKGKGFISLPGSIAAPNRGGGT